jgi:hypothetical protein
MDFKSLFSNPVIIAIIVFYFIGMLIPKSESFTNTPQIIAATKLVQAGVPLHKAMQLGVSKEDYMTATYVLSHSS